MESDYRTVMKEESLSKKIGLMEDLEDMRREAEELKRKEEMKKMRQKKRSWLTSPETMNFTINLFSFFKA